jgi:hypothetical protein
MTINKKQKRSIILFFFAFLSIQTILFGNFLENPNPITSDTIIPTIASLESGDTAIMLNLDISGSFDPTMIDASKEAAYLILDMLDNNTHVGLVTFPSLPSTTVPLGAKGNFTHYTQMKQGIDAMISGGNTPYYQGIAYAINQLNSSYYKNFSSKHVLMMSDGQPNPLGNFSDYVDLSVDYNISINTVSFGNYDASVLSGASNDTGGLHLTASPTTNISALSIYYAEIGHFVEKWNNLGTSFTTISTNDTVHIGNYTVTDDDIRIYSYWDNTGTNCTIIVKDKANNTLTPFNKSNQDDLLAWAYYSVQALDLVQVFINAKDDSSETLCCGVNIASRNLINISNIKQTPSNPHDNEIITIQADVEGLSISSVFLMYRANISGWSNWTSLMMINNGSGTYSANIPPQTYSSQLEYKIRAVNSLNHEKEGETILIEIIDSYDAGGSGNFFIDNWITITLATLGGAVVLVILLRKYFNKIS